MLKASISNKTIFENIISYTKPNTKDLKYNFYKNRVIY